MQSRFFFPVSLVTLSLLSGCNNFQGKVSDTQAKKVSQQSDSGHKGSPESAIGSEPSQKKLSALPQHSAVSAFDLNNADGDLWQVTRNHFQLSDEAKHEAVATQIRWYQKHPNHMARLAENAARYYHYVLGEVLKRGLPAELAVLPAAESLYNPEAYSSGHAAGIWQIIPSTAKYLGVDRNSWYDGRKDIIESTKTALDYLESINKRFNGNWLHTMAAYNAGGGTVSRAIRKNKKAGKPTDFWSLKLPKETRIYVPRVLALSEFIRSPKEYGMKLPSIANKPYFDAVKLPGQLHLKQAAQLAGTRLAELEQLNPGFEKEITPPSGHKRLLVPTHLSHAFREALKAVEIKGTQWVSYDVKAGDSLGVIAEKFDTRIAEIKKANNLTSNKIRVGKQLLIPQLNLDLGASKAPKAQITQVESIQTKSIQKSVVQTKVATASRSDKSLETVKKSIKSDTPKDKHQVSSYTVKPGDTLWSIGAKHKVNIELIARWNNLSTSKPIRVGQVLRLGLENKAQTIGYKVKSGDSLSSIADRHSVSIADIREWNDMNRSSNLIRSGQNLKIYIE